MFAKFGPGGNSAAFSKKYKSTADAPLYLKEMGLSAYEYECGQGVKISQASAEIFGKNAKENGISLSLHSPYFISLSSVEKEKRDNSIQYILQSAQAASWMGADRIVIHSGSCAKITREEALELAKDTLRRARQACIENGFENLILCPETMGKINQLGDLNEVMELCLVDDSFLPCIDFGHLNARTFGSIKDKADYERIINTIENRLGSDRAKLFHSHFSKIEFTPKGGEKAHLTFKDEIYGPQFEPLMEIIAKKNLTPTFICESAGTQDVDALSMMTYYKSLF